MREANSNFPEPEFWVLEATSWNSRLMTNWPFVNTAAFFGMDPERKSEHKS
jgi:hypothetical protein